MTWPPPVHVPVLLAECVELLRPAAGMDFIDGTVDGGGHSDAILQRTRPNGRLLALDADPEAVAAASRRFSGHGGRVRVRHANFRHLSQIASEEGFGAVNGILLDLGFSSSQLDGPGRGFSFNRDEPLDMRFDRSSGQSAAEVVATSPVEELELTLRTFGEEPRARRIASRIAEERLRGMVKTTGDLARIVEQAVGGRRGRTHPATRTFQALRIAVNDELGALDDVLPQAVALLRPGGRVAVIAFHSLEDRRVKAYFRRIAGRETVDTPRHLPAASGLPTPIVRLVTPHPIRPGLAELALNPRSRSARLRAVERI